MTVRWTEQQGNLIATLIKSLLDQSLLERAWLCTSAPSTGVVRALSENISMSLRYWEETG